LFSRYAIIGDDVCIGNKKVADKYVQIMENTLGVVISKEKSISGDRTAEFAKMIVRKGQIYTSIP